MNNIEEINKGYFAEYNPITVRDLEVEVNLEYLNFFLLSKCDFVAIGRKFLLDPNWLQKSNMRNKFFIPSQYNRG